MQKFINTVTGFLFGLAPMIVAAIIGLAFYVSFPNFIGITILVVLEILAFWVGFKIFKRVQILGPSEWLTFIHASPDLDNLEPTKDSATKRKSPEELVNQINLKENTCKGGTIRIFGDWLGRPYDNYHELNTAQFDQTLNLLTLHFTKGEQLEIYNPEHIFEASTFLKIVKADSIKLTFFDPNKTQTKENQYLRDYRLNDKKITTKASPNWYKPTFDVSLGEPALMIYG